MEGLPANKPEPAARHFHREGVKQPFADASLGMDDRLPLRTKFSDCCGKSGLDLIIQPMIRNHVLAAFLASLLVVGGIALAQRPGRNVSATRHPNLAAAQRLSRQAWERIVEAQRANEWDMQGHAQKAKDLLDQANNELKLAAEAANRRAR
jgi:hypothetical protein